MNAENYPCQRAKFAMECLRPDSERLQEEIRKQLHAWFFELFCLDSEARDGVECRVQSITAVKVSFYPVGDARTDDGRLGTQLFSGEDDPQLFGESNAGFGEKRKRGPERGRSLSAQEKEHEAAHAHVPQLLTIAGGIMEKLISLPPEFGFVSRSQYTNACFGFCLPLPADLDFKVNSLPIPEPFDPSDHYLFGAESTSKGLVTMMIGATKSSETGIFQPRNLRDLSNVVSDVVQFAGRTFSRVRWQNEVGYHDFVYSCAYTLPLQGFLVSIFVAADYEEVLKVCEQCIQRLAFFNPELALQQVGPDSQPYCGMQRSQTK